MLVIVNLYNYSALLKCIQPKQTLRLMAAPCTAEHLQFLLLCKQENGVSKG